MATTPIPAPVSSADSQGPGAAGGFASPAPAVEDQGAATLLKLLMTIVSSSRMIGQKVPGTVPEVRQINDLVQRMQAKIVAQKAPTEPMAPPV